MGNTSWIWFVGCIVWLVDAGLSLHFRSLQHAELALLLALVFLAAGALSRRMKR